MGVVAAPRHERREGTDSQEAAAPARPLPALHPALAAHPLHRRAGALSDDRHHRPGVLHSRPFESADALRRPRQLPRPVAQPIRPSKRRQHLALHRRRGRPVDAVRPWHRPDAAAPLALARRHRRPGRAALGAARRDRGRHLGLDLRPDVRCAEQPAQVDGPHQQLPRLDRHRPYRLDRAHRARAGVADHAPGGPAHSRGTAVDPPGALRGGARRRRRPLGDVQAHHAAAGAPRPGRRHGRVADPLTERVRPGLRAQRLRAEWRLDHAARPTRSASTT